MVMRSIVAQILAVFVIATFSNAQDGVRLEVTQVLESGVLVTLDIPEDALRARVTQATDLKSWQLTQGLSRRTGSGWSARRADGTGSAPVSIRQQRRGYFCGWKWRCPSP